MTARDQLLWDIAGLTEAHSPKAVKDVQLRHWLWLEEHPYDDEMWGWGEMLGMLLDAYGMIERRKREQK